MTTTAGPGSAAAAAAAATAPPAIEIERLTVKYGRRIALDGATLRVPAGSVYALLGRNGAGKSSLVRALLGQIRPSAGTARILGLDAWRRRAEAMARTGVVPEEPDVPPAMSADAAIAFCGRLYPKWDAAGAAARLDRFSIPRRTPFGKLSKGQKGLVSLALALGHSPEVLVMDDPTLGLDAFARRAVYEELIGDLADRGTTVFLTTHDLAGVEGIADRVGILRESRLVLDEPMDAIKERFSKSLEEVFLELAGEPAGGAA